ncbi:unnamed protein product [Miscanthus lutarioriparius]|uniref:Rx N-terminal domain-containing protein n=1 Tax=Miscanthus lutarioriparius TaxID=422564 RepID=A0A811SII1_9POAL|nr:unnamed protein product [Miscanthus lutarioriparius]
MHRHRHTTTARGERLLHFEAGTTMLEYDLGSREMKCSKPPALVVEESLQRALLRAQVIIEEAMGRHITNQSMIHQLDMLRDAMHQDYYALDAFRYQPYYVEEDGKDQAVNYFISVSKVPSPMEPYFSGQTARFLQQLREALDRLSSMIVDLNELVMFLMSYPRLYRQPYSMHILLENTEFQKHQNSPRVFLPRLPEQEGRTHMEDFLPTVLRELMTRPINFIINKCLKRPAMAMEDSLQRALLRAQVIDEEAMGRHITNQALIQQLGMLRDAMHRGYYALDAFRYQPHYGEEGNDPAIRGFMSLSKVPSPKDPYFFSRTAQSQVQLEDALDRLRSMMFDLNESVIFMMSYPRLYRQPCSMHILLGNCMFGRQMEAELVIKFLLHTHPHCSQDLEVMPIVGPPRVGKSTLVAHVCKDERVRDYFSEILWLCEFDFTNDELVCRQGCVMNHQNCMPNSNRGKRFLVVIELSGNLSERHGIGCILVPEEAFLVVVKS